MDYEKKYKEALETARKINSGEGVAAPPDWTSYEVIFPELKESEDDRIVRCLLNYFNHVRYNGLDLKGTDVDEVIVWLEKQGEQKSVDKAEPKFKVGDFIINDYCLGKVIEITNDAYLLDTGQGIPFSCENAHLWTIADAKDGDVLVTTAIRNCPFIYRKTDYNNNLAYYYAGIDGSGDFCEGCIKRTSYHFGPLSNVVPATKEQRDLLFQKMKEAGYEWDADKKELKKIEPKKLDADKVIAWLVANICDYEFYVKLFKKDFGL